MGSELLFFFPLQEEIAEVCDCTSAEVRRSELGLPQHCVSLAPEPDAPGGSCCKSPCFSVGSSSPETFLKD